MWIEGLSMQTADWALVVSLFSAAISLFSLGWGIWSKWVHPKPKLKVGFAVMYLFGDNGRSRPFLGAFATNFGPTDTTLKNLVARHRTDGWWWKLRRNARWQYGLMNSMRTPEEALAAPYNPVSGLPFKLAVGEEFSTYLIFEHEHLRDDGFVDVGFVDVFGRYHWAPRRSVKKVIASIKDQWPKEAVDK